MFTNTRIPVICVFSCCIAFAGCADKQFTPEMATGDPPTASSGDGFTVKLETSKGDVLIEVHPEWAPHGAKRFRELVEAGFYDDCRFFRVLEGFMAQTGINGDPAVHAKWKDKTIPGDRPKQSNQKGFVTFAMGGSPDTRSTQFFINYRDSSYLDKDGFAPFGQVIEGMDVVEALYSGYGEGAPNGRGPSQGRVVSEGNEFLNREFPKLDFIKTARIVGNDQTGKTESKASTSNETAKTSGSD